jgi:hypothetical protein
MNKHITVIVAILLSLSLVSALSIVNVESNPEEIMPGETARVSIKIENTLGQDITNLNVKLDLSEMPFAPYQSSAERFLDELDQDDDETFEFEVIALASTDTGIYKVPVIMEYLDENETEQTKQGLISLVVNSEVELNIFSEDAVLIRGKENTFSIKIVNSGLSNIGFAYLEVSNVIGIKFISETEQYIGDIDSNDFDSVEFKAYINPSSPSPITIPVTLKYRDATNKEFTEQKEITLNVYSLKEAQEMGLVSKPNYTAFFGIGGIVVVFVGYKILKKRKLKKRK